MNQVMRSKEEELAISMIDEMKEMDYSSEEFQATMKSFVSIRDVINDSEKIEVEHDIKSDQIELDRAKFHDESELSIRKIQLEEISKERELTNAVNFNKTDAIVKGIGIGATLAAELIKLGAFGRFYHQGMEYEKTDSWSTMSTKSLAQGVSKIIRF